MSNRLKGKRVVLLLWLLLQVVLLNGQIVEPVKWNCSVVTERENVRIGDEVVVRLTVNIEEGWHVYGMEIPEGGPQATEVVVTEAKGVEALKDGRPKVLTKMKTAYDSTFMMTLGWWEKRCEMELKYRVTAEKWSVKGYVRYMCCDDESCLPPTKWVWKQSGKANLTEDESLEKDGGEYIMPKGGGEKEMDEASAVWKAEDGQRVDVESGDERSGLLWVFLFGVIGGLLALLTPCVWPILPMTVSFFLKRKSGNGRRDALLYGLSIFVIYVVLGLVVTIVFGADALNNLSTNWLLNVLFFVLMVVFALSFLGYFDMSLPSSWGNKLNEHARGTTGFVSILLMASVLVIVSFSCTGPIVGTLLVEASVGGELMAPFVGMSGFALGLAVPFALCALFPSVMAKLPKSGGWMAHIKVILAAIEMLFALKFLSVADMTMGWGILPRWLFIALWALVGFVLALYMIGFVNFPCNYGDKTRTKAFKIAAVLPLAFSIYMVSGYMGNTLKAVSAFLPPKDMGVAFEDWDEGMSYAKEKGMPVFIDFTGYGCVNCRKMEAAVFSQEEIEKELDKYVVIRLYTDSRDRLEKKEIAIEKGDTIEIETIGEKNSYLQRSRYGVNAQPYYVKVDARTGEQLGEARAYDEDVTAFLAWLREGLSAYYAK